MKSIAIALLYVLAVSARLTNADSVRFDIDKKLEDGDKLNSDEVTRVDVLYDCVPDALNRTQVRIAEVNVTRAPKFGNEDVKLYFANDVKNILEVTVKTKGFSGVSYTVPFGSSKNLGEYAGQIGDVFQQIGATSVLHIDQSWFPSALSRLSGSSERKGVVYNYYGLKNYPISLPDRYVVENYKKVSCE